MIPPIHRCFAILPAAGNSRRMGRPKLLLPWGDSTVIDRVLQSWTDSNVGTIVIVIRRDDRDLFAACRSWPVHIVRPKTNPVDMKHSVQVGLREIEKHFRPTGDDHCFVAPADLPTLQQHVIDRMVAVARRDRSVRSRILVPEYAGKPSHPVLLAGR